jgi:hypothetical protein
MFMSAPEDSTEVAHLYRQLSDSFQAKDDEAIRRIYRELLRLGRPRSEIVNEAARLASNGAGFAKEGPAGRARAETQADTDRIAKMHLAAGVSLKLSQPDATLRLPENQGPVENIIVGAAKLSSDSIPKIIQEDVSDDIAPHDATLKITLLPRSAVPRLACALAGIAVALISALALLPNVSTAEKATPSLSANSRQDPFEAPTEAMKVTTGAAELGTNNRATAHMAPPLEKAGFETKPVESGNATARLGGVVATLGPTSGQRPQNAVPGAALRQPDSPISSKVLSPQTAPSAPAVSAMASNQEPRLSSGDVALLLTRGDSLFGTGDLVSARLFYERAANAGSGQAALRMGESYDPYFLERTHLRGARGDVAAAIYWYKRARDLGVTDATILLNSLPSK